MYKFTWRTQEHFSLLSSHIITCYHAIKSSIFRPRDDNWSISHNKLLFPRSKTNFYVYKITTFQSFRAHLTVFIQQTGLAQLICRYVTKAQIILSASTWLPGSARFCKLCYVPMSEGSPKCMTAQTVHTNFTVLQSIQNRVPSLPPLLDYVKPISVERLSNRCVYGNFLFKDGLWGSM